MKDFIFGVFIFGGLFSLFMLSCTKDIQAPEANYEIATAVAKTNYCKIEVETAEALKGYSLPTALKTGNVVCLPCVSPCADVKDYPYTNAQGDTTAYFSGEENSTSCRPCADGDII